MTRAADLAVLSPNVAVSGSNIQFDSGYGSVATAYGCRAWVNFNGTGTVAIRASGNVSSITDNGAGNYTINFTNAFEDENYSAVTAYNLHQTTAAYNSSLQVSTTTYSTTALNVRAWYGTGGASLDASIVNVAIFR